MESALPSATATNMDPYTLKVYVDIPDGSGIFDGAGANRIDTGTALYNFTVRAPEFAVSFSTTTSSTTTTTSTTT